MKKIWIGEKMTSEQKCPLCGQERQVWEVMGYPRYKCKNIDCVLCGKEILHSTDRAYQSQIARIKQEAKEECLYQNKLPSGKSEFSIKLVRFFDELKKEAKQEVFDEIRKFSKGLSCDETCKNNPISCQMEQRMIRAFQIIEENLKKKRGVE